MRKPKAERQGIVAKLRTPDETGDGYPHLLLDVRLAKAPRKNKNGNAIYYTNRYTELPVAIPTDEGENDLDVSGLTVMVQRENIAPDTIFEDEDEAA